MADKVAEGAAGVGAAAAEDVAHEPVPRRAQVVVEVGDRAAGDGQQRHVDGGRGREIAAAERRGHAQLEPRRGHQRHRGRPRLHAGTAERTSAQDEHGGFRPARRQAARRSSAAVQLNGGLATPLTGARKRTSARSASSTVTPGVARRARSLRQVPGRARRDHPGAGGDQRAGDQAGFKAEVVDAVTGRERRLANQCLQAGGSWGEEGLPRGRRACAGPRSRTNRMMLVMTLPGLGLRRRCRLAGGRGGSTRCPAPH